MEKLVKLFEPGKIGSMELKNRLIAAPLGYGFTFATKPDGFVTDRLIAYNEARAKGGVGLIQLTTGILARPHANTLIFGPGVLGLRTDDHIAGGQKFVQAMHAHGTKVSFLMNHMGAILSRIVLAKPPVEYPEFFKVPSPSGFRDPFTGFLTHTLNEDEIEDILEAFAAGARRGKAAGFDAALIHAGHGYLIHEFLSPRTNMRKDKWGGSLEKRAHFACELIKRVRKAVGPDFPIIFRYNGDDHLEGGITVQDAQEQAVMFQEAGVNALDISCGPFETHQWQFPNLYMPNGTLVPLAAAIKKVAKVPVIAVGKLDAVQGERVLQEGWADFIQLGRALMADPDLPNKAKAGKLAEIRPCIYCGWCQVARESGAFASCSTNIGIGREQDFKLEPALKKKKVMVIGGGPAGMEAARNAAERGHQVTLYEKSERLGGQWAILADYIPDQIGLINYLANGLKTAGVKVNLNQEVTRQTVTDFKPDAVIVATGSKSLSLDVPGVNGKNVVQAADVLSGKARVGKQVVVIGGRILGCDAALYLAEKGKEVTLISRSKIARGITHNLKQTLMEFLSKNKVLLYPYTVPDSITKKGVNVWYDGGDTAERENVFFFLPADTVVLAVGASNDNWLGEELTGLVPETYLIGDCSGKRSIFAALHDGSDIGRKI
jgi:2,4-dienoyl-CoA reductase-like NADH-dependent reductase (Old Yellow Enzyme family)/thioredoxin reductase